MHPLHGQFAHGLPRPVFILLQALVDHGLRPQNDLPPSFLRKSCNLSPRSEPRDTKLAGFPFELVEGAYDGW